METALAIERYRLAHQSRLPETLSALPAFCAGVPADPYDGHPLRFGKGQAGYVVYSIGRERSDDRGKPLDPQKQGTRGVLAFRIQR
jgi:hypothetical protein